MDRIVNDQVCEFIKDELRDEGIIIDVNDDIIHKIIKQYVGCSDEFLLDDEGVEYEDLRLSEFYSIPGGRWLDNNNNIIENEHVYIKWYNFGEHLVDPIKEFNHNRLSEYAEDYELYER